MQFRDLKKQYAHLKPQIDEGIQDVINQSSFILGKQVTQLEKELATFASTSHCVSCANGTDALQLVLMAFGIGAGDAVFTSDFTYFASAGTASVLGATPVFVDIDLATFNICPDALEKAIQQTLKEGKLMPKVIVPVDLFGLPANYPRLEIIAQKYGLKILEDGAQGFGGSIQGKRACSFGQAATTSFFPAKPLGCYGDGGAIFTNDSALDVTLRSLRVQGRSPQDKYDNRMIGLNSRLDTLQAAILLPKLHAFAETELDAVNQVAQWYTQQLEQIVVTPVTPMDFYSSWAQYTVLLENCTQRNFVQQQLKAAGIPSMVYYPRGLHQQSAYAAMGLSDNLFPNTLAAAARVLSLPMHPYLTKTEVDQVCACLIHAVTV